MNESNRVKEYLIETLRQKLQNEIDAYVKRSKHSYKDAWEIITYNEIAMLSLVKSAMVRGEEATSVWALQEYEVFKEDKPQGRADLFAFYHKDGNHWTFLIEAKRDGKYNPNSKDDNNLELWETSLNDAMKQGMEYYEAEQDYFNETSFVITMFFGTFEEGHEKDYKRPEIPPIRNGLDTAEYRFIVAPKEAPQKLCVYGQIQKIS